MAKEDAACRRESGSSFSLSGRAADLPPAMDRRGQAAGSQAWRSPNLPCCRPPSHGRLGSLRSVQRPPSYPGGPGTWKGLALGGPAAPSGDVSVPPGTRTNAPELRAQGCEGGQAVAPRTTPHKFAARAQQTPRAGKASAQPAGPAGPPPSPVAQRSRPRVLISGWDRLCVWPERDRGMLGSPASVH